MTRFTDSPYERMMKMCIRDSCFTAGALVGVPLFFLLREPAGNSMAAMCMMLSLIHI